jgi:cellulose biosynthesis protein BcsQ
MTDDCIVIAFVSGKGGTGKTTLTANFAIELASSFKTDVSGHREDRKSKVLVIDNDYATGGTSYLLAGGERLKSGAEADKIKTSACFYDCYAINISPADVTPLGLIFSDGSVGDFEVDVLLNSLAWWRTPDPDSSEEETPSSADRTKAESSFLDHDLLPYYEQLLKRFRKDYDWLLIESRGGADTRASVAAVVADAIIIVSEPGEVAAKQDTRFVESLHRMAGEVDRPVGPIALILNRVLEAERDRGKRTGTKIIGRLPISQRVVECYRNTELIFDRSPADPFCIAAIEAYKHWFPHERGVCQARMRLSRVFMKLRGFFGQLGGYLSWCLTAIAIIAGIGAVGFAMRGEAATLGWLQPVLILGGVVGVSLLVVLIYGIWNRYRHGRSAS